MELTGEDASRYSALSWCFLFSDCSYTADTMSELKDHMYVCDFSRNSPALICVHCNRVSKTVENLMEHLRSHGLHRYSCGSCNTRAATINLIANHMKKVHYFTEYNVVPLHPLHKDPDKSLFTVIAKVSLIRRLSYTAHFEGCFFYPLCSTFLCRSER